MTQNDWYRSWYCFNPCSHHLEQKTNYNYCCLVTLRIIIDRVSISIASRSLFAILESLLHQFRFLRKILAILEGGDTFVVGWHQWFNERFPTAGSAANWELQKAAIFINLECNDCFGFFCRWEREYSIVWLSDKQIVLECNDFQSLSGCVDCLMRRRPLSLD